MVKKIIVITFFFLIGILNAQVGELIWEENFENLDNWSCDLGNGSWGWGNGELEFYRQENVEISEIPGEPGNKALHITAKAESDPGFTDQWGNPLNFTSGKVTTKAKVAVKYGMIEVRLQVPDINLGGWPAFWLLGTANYSWPYKGEIDIMEMGQSKIFRDLHDTHNGGNGADNSTVNMVTGANAIFYAESAINPENPSGAASISWDPGDQYCRLYYNHANPLNNRFMIYRMYWDDTSIRFTVIDDGVENDLFTEPFPIDSVSAEFQAPFYFITNLAIGGAFTDAYNLGDPGSGESVSMPFPADMYVDYIKVYKWNNQGEVRLGPPAIESGTFGIYTDETATNVNLEAGITSEIYIWAGTLTDGSIEPYEGDNGISWQSTGQGWFGAGIMSIQPRNMSEFGDGYLTFRIKIPANVTFKIGITDTWDNQNYLEFPANETKYGLVRDGNWGQASIPISELRGTAIDLRMMAYMFVILNEDGASCEFGLDDIFWSGQGNPIANAGPNQTIKDYDENGEESVTLDGSGSSGWNSPIVSYSWSKNDTVIATGVTATVSLNLGEHIITLTVTDEDGNTNTDQVIINVLDNYPPVADAGQDQTIVDEDEDGVESVLLDGSASTDSDGNIVNLLWTENDTEIASGENPTVDLNIGKHIILLTITDDDGATASDEVIITINNNLPIQAPVFCFTNEAITIDENIDQAWYNTPEMEINNVTVGTRTADFHAQWKGMFDNDNLYLLVEVTDGAKINDSGTSWWEDDGIEVFIDGDNSKNTSYDGVNDFQYGFRWDDGTINLGNNSLNNITNVLFSTYSTSVGYNIEVSVPWSTIGVSAETIDEIGFDVAVDDDDNGGGRECAVASIFTADNAWHNPSVLGSIPLDRSTNIVGNEMNEKLSPTEFRLEDNYPNPFNPETTINYILPKTAEVKLSIYDIKGNIVKNLVNCTQKAGHYSVTFQGNNLSSGIYFYRINAGNFNMVKRMLLIK